MKDNLFLLTTKKTKAFYNTYFRSKKLTKSNIFMEILFKYLPIIYALYNIENLCDIFLST